MSITENAERYMKRYDYLIEKRERKYKQGKRLTSEEDEELRNLRPNVFTPIMIMFELLHDTVKSNQTIRKSTLPHTHPHVKQNQRGGQATPTATATASSAATATAVAAAAVAAATAAAPSSGVPPKPTTEDDAEEGDAEEGDEEDDAEAKEAQRLSELEESLMPLLTKIIVYIEQNKKKEQKKEEEDEEEKYPDIGTTAKNSAILVIRRIKKWWNDLISGGTSDLSSKINLKKAIPQLPNNDADMNKIIDKAEAAIHKPLERIEKLLSHDVRDIASSSVEGIMNALSLIPGIGTTLQLWRLLQNVVVIMSKSVTTMAGAKTQGVDLKAHVQALKGDMEAAAQGAAKGAAEGAAKSATGDLAASVPGGGDLAGAAKPEIPETPNVPKPEIPTAPSVAAPAAPSVAAPAVATPTAPAVATSTAPAVAAPAVAQGGGSNHHKSNHLRSIKKYKREYKQSLREIRKTRKKMMKYIRNII